MAYWWATASLDAMRHLAETYSPSTFSVTGNGAWANWRLLPEARRKRILAIPWSKDDRPPFSDFVFSSHREHVFDGSRPPATYGPVIYARQAYGSTIATVYGVNPSLLSALHADRFRETYRSATSGPPAAHARYDVYVDGGALTYARAPCVPADLDARFFLHVFRTDAGDPPEDHVRYDNLDFDMPTQALFDGKCLATARLPAYGVDRVETGQFNDTGRLWTAAIQLAQ